MRYAILLITLTVACITTIQQLAADETTRKWTDASGKRSVVATLVDVSQDTVRLRTSDGREIDVPIAKLSAADQEFLDRQESSPPNVDFEVAKTEKPRPKPESEHPRLSVKEFQAEMKDKEAYKKKWVGKTIELEGWMGDVGWHQADGVSSGTIRIRASNIRFDIGHICWGKDESFQPWKSYQKGKAGILRVLADVNRRGYPVLKEAEYVWSAEGGYPLLEAKDLTAAFHANPEETREAYAGKYVLVRGKLLRHVGEEGQRRVILEGAEGINFELHGTASEGFYASEVGDIIEIIGECQIGGVFLAHEKIGAAWCKLVPAPRE